MNLPENKYKKVEPDHTKVAVTPIFEKNPVNDKDVTVGVGLRIPLDKVANFFKKLFGRK